MHKTPSTNCEVTFDYGKTKKGGLGQTTELADDAKKNLMEILIAHVDKGEAEEKQSEQKLQLEETKSEELEQEEQNTALTGQPTKNVQVEEISMIGCTATEDSTFAPAKSLDLAALNRQAQQMMKTNRVLSQETRAVKKDIVVIDLDGEDADVEDEIIAATDEGDRTEDIDLSWETEQFRKVFGKICTLDRDKRTQNWVRTMEGLVVSAVAAPNVADFKISSLNKAFTKANGRQPGIADTQKRKGEWKFKYLVYKVIHICWHLLRTSQVYATPGSLDLCLFLGVISCVFLYDKLSLVEGDRESYMAAMTASNGEDLEMTLTEIQEVV